MSGNEYVSTSGDVSNQPFAVSPDTPGMKRASRIFAQFLVELDQTLAFINDAFVGGRAIFCVSGTKMLIVFDEILPQGCTAVALGVVPVESVDSGPTSSSTVLPPSNSGTPSLSTSILSAPMSTTPVAAGSSQSASSSSNYAEPLTSVSGAAYPAPTTTGTPNCYDRSPFDGTVNDNYLILCDTDLPAYDLAEVPASDIAECISACSSYVPTSQGLCVAVEFDIVSSYSPNVWIHD